jgi:nicotinamidase-related amidase
MLIPQSGRRVALAIVDVQSAFITRHSKKALKNIVNLLQSFPYNAYVEASFSAEPQSLWHRQTGWFLPRSEDTRTVHEIARLLCPGRVWRIHKHTKSIFGDGRSLTGRFRGIGIEEVHLVGFDLNDCVLASAFDSFDAGFFTYIIEECCASSEGKELTDHALALLRHSSFFSMSSRLKSKPIACAA